MIEDIKKIIETEGSLSKEELLFLYNNADMNTLSDLATKIRKRLNQDNVYYNRNFHIEPSNICKFRCKFCSYRRDSADLQGAWDMSIDEIRKYALEKYEVGMTEVHIVGSVHPEKDLDYYLNIIRTLREIMPSELCIKAYSAIEIIEMAKQENICYEDILIQLKDAGLGAIPGGGAEIFNPHIREEICPDKPKAEEWLSLHRSAHKLGIKTNATMLFGHIESIEDRIDHILSIRNLQDEYHGFNAFIPLKFRAANNYLEKKGEINILEVLKCFAISRIALNNIPHIKSYWPMLGKETCQLSLLYGADDIDGTINDSTKIYSMAGAEEDSPYMTVSDLQKLARSSGYKAVERDSAYNILK